MSNPFFEILSTVFPLLFLMVFGFVALIWSALLMLMFINTVRVLKQTNDDGDNKSDSVQDDDRNSPPSQPPQRPRPRKRNHVRLQANNQPGTAAQHSLPPYISSN